MSALDIPGLLQTLDRGDVNYVLIGAAALAAHGPVRATEDLDLVPDPDADNLRRLVNTLAGIDARLASDLNQVLGPSERTALSQGRSLTLETELGALNVIQRAEGVPSFAELRGEATEMELFGVPVLVCSRRHLRQMKLARGTHRDLADIEDLDIEPNG